MAAKDLVSEKQQRELATGFIENIFFEGMTTKLFSQETPEQEGQSKDSSK